MPDLHPHALFLALAAAPYLSLAAVDAWMHERARRVPLAEQALHAVIALALALFFGSVFTAQPVPAYAALAAFALVYSADEFGFHRHILARERRVHAAAAVALLGFVLVWRWLEGRG